MVSFRSLVAVAVLAFFGLFPGRVSANLLYDCNVGLPDVIHAQVVIIYWGWYDTNGNWTDPLGEAPVLESFINGIGGTRYWNILAQYYQQVPGCGAAVNVQNGPMPIFWIFREPSKPGPNVTLSDLKAEVNGVAAVLGNPDPANTIYVVAFPRGIVPPDMQVGSDGDPNGKLCAYHGGTDDPIGTSGHHIFTEQPYFETFGDRPDFRSNCGSGAYDALTGAAQHEIAESMLGGWSGDGTITHGEIGDACEDLPRAVVQVRPSSDPNYRVSIQPLWSNLAQQGSGGCVLARATRSDAFVIGTDGNLYRELVPNSSFESWGAPASPIASAPAAVSHDPQYIDVFVRASNGHVYQAYTQNGGMTHGGWADWGAAPAPYTFYGKPTVASWGASRLDIYTGGQDAAGHRTLFHRSWDNGAASSWTAVTTNYVPASSPAATSWGPSRIDVVQLGQDGLLHQLTSTDGTNYSQQAWPSVATTLVGDPDIGSHQRGYLDAFIGDVGGQIWHAWQYPSGQFTPHGWDALGSPPSVVMRTPSNPAVVGMGDYRLRVRMTGSDGSVWMNMYDYGWTGWQPVLWQGGTWSGGAVSSW